VEARFEYLGINMVLRRRERLDWEDGESKWGLEDFTASCGCVGGGKAVGALETPLMERHSNDLGTVRWHSFRFANVRIANHTDVLRYCGVICSCIRSFIT
jgi:hypothetical protein